MNKWGRKSKANYRQLSEDLQVLADAVLEVHDCSILQAYREEAVQNKYFANGTSKVQWPDSKHNSMPSDAMDLAPHIPGADPYDMENVLRFGGLVVGIAAKLYKEGVMERPIIWGGTWRTEGDAVLAFDRISANGKKGFFDGVHFERAPQ